jgi:hypothetical protein
MAEVGVHDDIYGAKFILENPVGVLQDSGVAGAFILYVNTECTLQHHVGAQLYRVFIIRGSRN